MFTHVLRKGYRLLVCHKYVMQTLSQTLSICVDRTQGACFFWPAHVSPFLETLVHLTWSMLIDVCMSKGLTFQIACSSGLIQTSICVLEFCFHFAGPEPGARPTPWHRRPNLNKTLILICPHFVLDMSRCHLQKNTLRETFSETFAYTGVMWHM